MCDAYSCLPEELADDGSVGVLQDVPLVLRDQVADGLRHEITVRSHAARQNPPHRSVALAQSVGPVERGGPHRIEAGDLALRESIRKVTAGDFALLSSQQGGAHLRPPSDVQPPDRPFKDTRLYAEERSGRGHAQVEQLRGGEGA